MRSLLILLLCCAATTAAHAQFEIIIQFAGMTPHVDQMLGIRVTERTSGLEAAKVVIPKIKQADFEVRILCGRADIDYNVDFFADLNKNGAYDPPPTDHAWRELVGIINNHAVVEFQHNLNFTDIQWPPKSDPMPSKITRDYAGSWHNNTFDTDGDATASITWDYAAKKGSGTITTSGAFGNPTPITITATGSYDPVKDSMALSVQSPFVGVIFFIRGEVAGAITHPEFGVNLGLSGNSGDGQLMLNYDMSGGATADGYFSMQATNVTGVDEEEEGGSDLSATPNPADDVLHIRWHEKDGEPVRLYLVNVAGMTVATPKVLETSEGHAEISVSSLSPAAYLLVLELQHRTVTRSVIVQH